MSKVLYVEPDDEITDLVDKIRRSGEEQELVFVLPHRTRVLQSPLNLRLLQQYSRSFVKNTAIVSGDPRVQQLAKQSGFATYASVQAYERGVQVVRPHAPAEPTPMDGDEELTPAGIGAGAGARAAAGTTVAEPAWAATVARPERPAGTPRGPQPPRRPLPAGPPRGGDRRRLYYYAAAAIFVIGLLLLFLVAPSATVTIKLTATPISANNPIQGTTDPNLANSPDHVLTIVATADETQQFQANPSGHKTLPATAATAQVVMQTDLKNVADFTVPKGTEFDTSGQTPIRFYATQDTLVHFGDPDPNTGMATSNPIPVQDGTPEAQGNVPANSITQWPNNPCGPNGQDKNVCSSSDLTVSNPQPAQGGADQKQVVVASQDDVNGWNDQVKSLKDQLSTKGLQDMGAKAGAGKTLAKDPTGGGVTLTWDVTPLPHPNDQYTQTTITVTLHAKGAYFDPNDVIKAVKADLQNQVPQGEQLADNPQITQPKITQAADDGTVIFTSNGTGFSEPIINVQQLKGDFTGHSPSDVKVLIRSKIPQVQDVQITQSIPFFVLPFFSGRIEVKQDVRAPSPSATPSQ